jgi:ribosomal protein S18 acetylase RimI-like enzyme
MLENSVMKKFKMRPLSKSDHDWVVDLLVEHWGSTKVVTRGKIHDADRLPGFIAIQENKPVGLVTYRIDGGQCEITSLNSLEERVGIGSALVNAVKSIAVKNKCKRVWLVTTNDNTPALHFWQKRGFLLVAVYRNAIEGSRRLKPEIGLIGMDGIPLRDEIELELLLYKETLS